jgi:hypothetical protein
MNKAWFLPIALLLLAAPAPVRAQFSYITNSDGASVTITGYTGSGGAVSIPASTNAPVQIASSFCILHSAFLEKALDKN